MKDAYQRWSDADKCFIIKSAGVLTDEVMAELLQRTRRAVQAERERLGYKYKRGPCASNKEGRLAPPEMSILVSEATLADKLRRIKTRP